MEETLHGWLDALASDAATPGGGAAAALLVATGAALVEMACGLTLGREKFKDVEPLMLQTRAAASTLRAQADRLRVEDSSAFEEVSAAYGLPRSTPDEKSFRTAQIQRALRHATEVPLRSTETGVAVLELAAAVASSANPNVISDVGAGALSARAGAEASALNVRINLASIKDEGYRADRGAVLADLLQRATVATETVLATVNAAIDR
ncbi:MAG: fch [Chloroflexi bacterium]|jgi:formiminotetrahydrofolate cyclodeaminase|nr:fch [Chloroflexota bacterium]MDB5075758.1 fch [Chloroflexota bacterium]